MKSILQTTFSGLAALALLSFIPAGETIAHDHKACAGPLQGEQRMLRSSEQLDLCEVSKDKVVLVVNTASQCGFTGQFEGLEALYQEYKDEGFTVIGFPSNSFRQEHQDEEDTAEVCYQNFGVTFPMMATSPVTGRAANPVFQELKDKTGTAPGWNFHKYLVGKDGEVITNFGSRTTPEDEALRNAIEQALKS